MSVNVRMRVHACVTCAEMENFHIVSGMWSLTHFSDNESSNRHVTNIPATRTKTIE